VKPAFTFVLSLLLIQTVMCADVEALQPATARSAPRVDALRKVVEKLGSGQDALVAVRLRDRSIVSGYLSEAGPRSFTVAGLHGAASRSIDYAQIDRLAGYNFSTGVRVQQGGGIRGKLAHLAAVVLPGKQVFRNNLTTSTKLVLLGIAIGILIAIIVAKTV
jgi:hypothetical protein